MKFFLLFFLCCLLTTCLSLNPLIYSRNEKEIESKDQINNNYVYLFGRFHEEKPFLKFVPDTKLILKNSGKVYSIGFSFSDKLTIYKFVPGTYEIEQIGGIYDYSDKRIIYSTKTKDKNIIGSSTGYKSLSAFSEFFRFYTLVENRIYYLGDFYLKIKSFPFFSAKLSSKNNFDKDKEEIIKEYPVFKNFNFTNLWETE